MPYLIRLCLFISLTLTLGLGSARYAIDRGLFGTSQHLGPWVTWMKEGTTEEDPYTLAHIARSGTLPLTSASALTFEAKADSKGARLNGNCTYEIKGSAFPSLWWNIAAYDRSGHSIANKTGRSSFNSGNIVTLGDGHFNIHLSPDVQPGNWLPTTKGEDVILRIRILRPLNADRLFEQGSAAMPNIAKTECL